ncbi:hypothetical protein IFM46972_05447 [Aspergillus udagawae]|uniref:Uncharacterized protein n=1 Tax=Aspergillus udagawae TaxID=91492 RepID=A0A8H3NUE4_9EURO|nr:hypothetical protein IFM46972_05447 [Aspergillus udagawae]
MLLFTCRVKAAQASSLEFSQEAGWLMNMPITPNMAAPISLACPGVLEAWTRKQRKVEELRPYGFYWRLFRVLVLNKVAHGVNQINTITVQLEHIWLD